MDVRPVRADELSAVNAIYASVSFAPCATVDHVVTIGELRALGRLLRHDDGALELGGIWVHPDERGKGHARAVVAALVARIDGPCWCLPFAPLDAFYQAFGFLPTDVPPPPAIAARVTRCDRLFAERVLVRLRP